MVDEEASSNSRGTGGEGSGQAAVSGSTGFQIFKFYHTLCHFFVVTDFFVVLFVYRRGGGGWTRLYIIFVELMFYSGGAWGQTDADILAWKFLVMTLRGC